MKYFGTFEIFFEINKIEFQVEKIENFRNFFSIHDITEEFFATSENPGKYSYEYISEFLQIWQVKTGLA